VLPYATAGRVMANLVLRPQVTAFLDVVTTAMGPDLQLAEIEVRETCPVAGRTIRDLRIRHETGAIVVALRKPDGSFDATPEPDTPLEVGDVLIGVGQPDEIRRLEDLFEPRDAVAR
jgi:voltage-gated potassium channel